MLHFENASVVCPHCDEAIKLNQYTDCFSASRVGDVTRTCPHCEKPYTLSAIVTFTATKKG